MRGPFTGGINRGIVTGVKIKSCNITSVLDVGSLGSKASDNQNTSLKQSLLSQCVY